MPETILTTKVTPPLLRPRLVSRPRLEEKIRQALHGPLTLVSAPAGFGKTTSVASALQNLRKETVFDLSWLSLEAADDEIVRFWHYFFAALRAHLHSAKRAVTTLAAPQSPPPQSLLVGAINEIAARSHPLLYVLDDLHLVNQPEIYAGLTFLLEHAPPNLHLVLLTRADPPLPLHRWRARDELTEIRAQELRFEETEAAAFFAGVMALPLEEAQIKVLTQQTEGWAVGMQLAALALQGADRGALPTFITRLGQNNRYVADYLTEEVLAQQTAALQSFLLQTSILSRLCGPLCDAIVEEDNSELLLEELVQRNLFLGEAGPPDEQGRRWFRYHQLFADLLQGHLRQQYPDNVATLHSRAATWYESEGDLDAAIEHALAGGDHALAAQCLEQRAPSLAMSGRGALLDHWLRQLPPTAPQKLARTHLSFAWTLLLRGRYKESAAFVQQAEQARRTDPDLRGEADALRASLASVQGQAREALTYARRAIATVPQENQFVHALAHFALAGALRERGDVAAAISAYDKALPLCHAAQLLTPEMLARAHLGMLYMIQGQLRQAEAVTRPATRPDAPPVAGAALIALGTVLLEWNRLPEAEAHLRRGITLAEESDHHASVVHGYCALARLHRSQGEVAAAHTALEAAATRQQQGVPTWVSPILVAERVHHLLAQGAVASATHLLAETEEGETMYGDELLALARVRILYHREQLDTAQAMLDGIIQDIEADGRRGRLIPALLLRALLYDRQKETAQAHETMRRVLLLAEPEEYSLLFMEEGLSAARLLAAVDSPYARDLLVNFPESIQSEAASSPATLPEPLTDREMEVLQLLARGLTYHQIADELIVSVNTVRHHIKGIYGKLQADKRTVALERARLLGLL